jgi:hypothetical protein
MDFERKYLESNKEVSPLQIPGANDLDYNDDAETFQNIRKYKEH